jgi:hypothetical protein
MHTPRESDAPNTTVKLGSYDTFIIIDSWFRPKANIDTPADVPLETGSGRAQRPIGIFIGRSRHSNAIIVPLSQSAVCQARWCQTKIELVRKNYTRRISMP